MKFVRALFLIAIFASLSAAGAFPATAQQIQVNRNNKTIAISASADAEATADTGVVTVGYIVYGKDQQMAYANAGQLSNAIINALLKDGVAKDAIASQQQNIGPIQTFDDADKARYASGIRFQCSQSWQITVPAAEAAKVLHVAIENGANQSGNIDWQMHDDEPLEAEAAQKALVRANSIAVRMAAGLGVALGPLLYASNQAPSTRVPILAQERARPAFMMEAQKSQPLSIEPQKITRSATVYAVFAIQ